jgi:hypothetical protein
MSWALPGLARSSYFPQGRLIGQFQLLALRRLKQKALIEIKIGQPVFRLFARA